MHVETLKTFRDLVDTGSFSRAAELNYISQSAVSQQLKSLEMRYECRLLERDRRGSVSLTEAGRLLYAECRELLERLRALDARLRDRTNEVAGPIRIATVYSIGLHQLPPYVTRLMKVYPEVRVHVEYSRTDKVCDACLSGAIDFGIVAFPVRRTNLIMVPWRDESLVLVCSPDHRFARKRSISVKQLHHEPFVAFERDIPTRKTVDRVLRTNGVRVTTVAEFDNVETIKRSVEVGHGISILPDSTVANEVKSRRLAMARLAEGPFTRSIGVVHRRGHPLSAAARAFIQLLTES